MKKLIIVTGAGFTKRDEERFQVNKFLESGVSCMVYDITHLICPERETNDCEILEQPYYFSFNTIADFKMTLLSHKEDSCIILPSNTLTYTLGNILKFLKFHNFCTLQLRLGNNPTKEFGLLETIKLKLQKITVRKIVYKLKILSIRWMYGDFNPSFILSSSPESSETSKIIFANSMDYDNYLANKDKLTKAYDNYVVFLDEDWPFHPDNEEQLGACLHSIAPSYYAKLNNFFKFIEKKYKTKVIVAVHPRAKLERTREYLKDFILVQGSTHALIKYSKFVLAHQSTSVSFTILYKKPIVFMMMDDIKKYAFNSISAFADSLNLVPLDVENQDKWEDISLNIDDYYYAEYIRKYLSPAFSNKQMYEIMIENILDENDSRG